MMVYEMRNGTTEYNSSHIRYPSMRDMKNEILQLENITAKIPDVKIVEITESLIIISDQYCEYEYDSFNDAIDEWNAVLKKIC